METVAVSAADRSAAHAHLLSIERQRALETLAARTAEYETVAASSMTAGRDDEHDPDGSTPAVEHSLAFGLLAAAVEQVSAMDRAIERLGAGTFGRCQRCGTEIVSERLEVLPTALTCVQCPRDGTLSGGI